MLPCDISQPAAIQWWNGDDYHLNSHHQYKLADETLFNCPFKGDEKVLDIGCGNGAITCFIAKDKVPYGFVVGIDSSSSMIQSAIANNSVSNAVFQEGLAESFRIESDFDVIVSFSTLHWISDQQAVWNNIRKHLKLGGQALVSLNPPPRNQEFTEAINEVVQSAQFEPYFRDFVEVSLMPVLSIDEYKQIVMNAGLRVDECVHSIKCFDYENKDVFIDNVKAWLPHVVRVPKESQRLFVEAIITKFLTKTQQDQVNIKFNYHNFMIKATNEKL